MKYVVVVTGIC